MRHARKGFTVMEVLVASIIGSVVAGGTLMAFVAAAKMTDRQSNPATEEAMDYAQQVLEQLRNAVDVNPRPNATFAALAGLGWIDALFPVPPGQAGTETIQNMSGSPPVSPKRKFCVKPQTCGGAVGDCYSVLVKVCWNGTTCPANGSACP